MHSVMARQASGRIPPRFVSYGSGLSPVIPQEEANLAMSNLREANDPRGPAWSLVALTGSGARANWGRSDFEEGLVNVTAARALFVTAAGGEYRLCGMSICIL